MNPPPNTFFITEQSNILSTIPNFIYPPNNSIRKERFTEMSNHKPRKQVVCSKNNVELLDLVGRLGISETAKHLNITPASVHNRIYGVRDRLEQGQAEINRTRNLMKKYPYIKRLLTPKTLKPTPEDLEPELYEEEEP